MLTANLIFSCECIPIQYIYSNHHNNNIKRGAWVVSSQFLFFKIRQIIISLPFFSVLFLMLDFKNLPSADNCISVIDLV